MPSEQTVERYRDATLALLPPGALARDDEAAVARVVEGAVVELARIDETAAVLEQSRVPLRAPGFLETWEALYGLPDPYAPTVPTTDAERRAAITAKINAAGDHSRPTYDAAAAALDLSIDSVTYYAPFEAGRSKAGDPVRADDWLFAVALGVSNAGDGTLADPVALARFRGVVARDLKRSHTLITMVADTGEGPVGDAVIDGSSNRVVDGSGNRVVP